MDRNLLTFLTIAETGNITAAAAQLHITQPTLTKRLQQLEAQHQCRLLERLPRGVQLTPSGHQLLPYARRIQHEFLQAAEAIRSFESGHLDELRIGSGPLFQMRYLASALCRLMSEFPDTTISLSTDLNTTNLPKIREGNLDLMFGTTEHLSDDDQVLFLPLTTVEQGILLRANHPALNENQIRPGQLANTKWIFYSDGLDNEEMMRTYFEAQGLPAPNIVMRVSTFTLGFQMVAQSDYAMILPVQLKPILDAAGVTLVTPDPPISRKLAGAYMRRSSRQYPIIKRLVEIVADATREADRPKTSAL